MKVVSMLLLPLAAAITLQEQNVNGASALVQMEGLQPHQRRRLDMTHGRKDTRN